MTTPANSDFESAQVHRLIGCPGGGKTTSLLEFVEQERDEQRLALDELYFVSFTNASRIEIADRIRSIYPDADSDDVDRHVKTLHGAALTECLRNDLIDLGYGDGPDDIIREDNDSEVFQYFFDVEHPKIAYDPDHGDLLEDNDGTQIERDGKPLGNRLMAAYDYLKSQQWDHEHVGHAPVELDDIDNRRAIAVLDDWDRYKDDNGLWQDDDYVELAYKQALVPDVSAVFIDEFQDLSPLQYGLYKEWRDHPTKCKRLYIAGDHHQSIYSFRGASPEYFRETDVDEETRLDTSYRCPSEVIDTATGLLGIGDVDAHTPDGITAADDGGDVHHITASEPQTLARLAASAVDKHDTLYLLARTNRQVLQYAKALRNNGVPYYDIAGSDGSYTRWDSPMRELLGACRAINRGDAVDIDAATALTSASESLPDDTSGFVATYADQDTIPVDTVADWYDGTIDDASDVIPELELDRWQRQLLVDALRSEATHEPRDLRIGTVHQAKGLEAGGVIMSAGYTDELARAYRDEPDTQAEENRIWYVALTRAEESVYVLHDYHDGVEFPPATR